MTEQNSMYRTLIRGTIEQTTAFAVGGSPGVEGNPDSCYRDGQQRLTIPGTSLAGALIEAAVRVFPQLITSNLKDSLLRGMVTGKPPQAPKSRRSGERDDCDFFQSVWRFRNARLAPYETRTEWRQAVGIRQATGAAARGALYDFEVVPVGALWDFFLEIDTYRGGAEAEALAILALYEWTEGRGWLGRGPARGTGWFRLTVNQVLRLARTPELLEAWPDNAKSLDGALQTVQAVGSQQVAWNDTVKEARATTATWQSGTWYYLHIPILLKPGPRREGYGCDVLQVGGHPAGELQPSSTGVLEPLSVASANWREKDYKQPDAPFVNTQPSGQDHEQPFLPGGGLRGPLRHTMSRLARAHGVDIRDPNRSDDLEKQRPHVIDQLRSDSSVVADAEVRQVADAITQIFGAEELCGRVLVSDAKLAGGAFQIARVEHLASDEFTAGVYASSKFDRNVLLDGDLEFQIILEAPAVDVLQAMARKLLPALELARLGHLPLGGGKWRGAGWVSWTIGPLELSRAGGIDTIREEDTARTQLLTQRFEQLFAKRDAQHD